ncbi:hypothetical protein ACO2Q2_03710 [Dyella sp. KRB-257]|uniref:hypothetical protein n=1 Tax=Dyella sp. KRB-257 TaxID=3400915 RepID=UPI003BFF3F56
MPRPILADKLPPGRRDRATNWTTLADAARAAHKPVVLLQAGIHAGNLDRDYLKADAPEMRAWLPRRRDAARPHP